MPHRDHEHIKQRIRFPFRCRLDLLVKHSSHVASGAFASGRCRQRCEPEDPRAGSTAVRYAAAGERRRAVDRAARQRLPEVVYRTPRRPLCFLDTRTARFMRVLERIRCCSGPRGLVTTPAAGTQGRPSACAAPESRAGFVAGQVRREVRNVGHPCRVARRSVARNLAGGRFHPGRKC